MNNKILQYGLMIGAINILMTLGLYVAGPAVMTGYGAMGLGLLVAIGSSIFFGLKAREDNGGYFTFGEAFKSIFVMGLIGATISTIFMYLLYNVIDPDLAQRVQDAALENAADMMRKMGLDEAAIEKGMEEASNQDPSMTIGKAAGQLAGASVMGAIGAAIIAAIIKRVNPNDEI